MKKVTLLLTLLFFARSSFAIAFSVDELLMLLSLNPKTATQQQVTSILGAPVKVEGSKKRTWWYYNQGALNYSICWRPEGMCRISFKRDSIDKVKFDERVSRQLKSGITDIRQALCLLGMPRDMTVKEMTQEVHYTYLNSVLRLFFREGVLVDYTLLGQK